MHSCESLQHLGVQSWCYFLLCLLTSAWKISKNRITLSINHKFRNSRFVLSQMEKIKRKWMLILVFSLDWYILHWKRSKLHKENSSHSLRACDPCKWKYWHILWLQWRNKYIQLILNLRHCQIAKKKKVLQCVKHQKKNPIGDDLERCQLFCMKSGFLCFSLGSSRKVL